MFLLGMGVENRSTLYPVGGFICSMTTVGLPLGLVLLPLSSCSKGYSRRSAMQVNSSIGQCGHKAKAHVFLLNSRE
jgi:hypothetical protein